MAGEVLGVDLGGTHMRAAVVTPAGELVDHHVQDTPVKDPRPDALYGVVATLAREHGVTEAVVGLPGRINYDDGVLEYAPHLPQAWLPGLGRGALAERTGLSVQIANDAELAAVGEAAYGAGRGYLDVVYMTFSTGIGGGVVQHGRVVHGTRSMPEPGHTIVDMTGFEARQPFAMEDFASGTALGRWASEAGIGKTASDVLAGIAREDPRALELWSRCLRMIRAAVFNMAMLFSPQVVVIGGGVGLNAPGLVEDVQEWLVQNPPPGLPPVSVVRAALGDDVGLLGAAAWSGMTAREPAG